MCFQRSLTFRDGELTFKYLITKIQTLRTQTCFNYATIMKTLEGAMEVWESFYSKNGRVWTILNMWWFN